MNIAVLSDIHGNNIALERCLKDITDRNVETLIFLGDFLGELAYPQRTMKLLYDLRERYRCYFIRASVSDHSSGGVPADHNLPWLAPK